MSVRPSVCFCFFSVQSGCYPSSQIVGHGFHGFTLLFSTDFVLAATNITGRSVNRYLSLSSAAAQHVLVGVAIAYRIESEISWAVEFQQESLG